MKKKLELSNVTLLAATSVNIDETQIAMRISLHNIKFGAVKLLSSSLPLKKYPDIDYVSIPAIDFMGYNRLIIEDLHKYFETSHCLIVQADSFVVNSDLWKDEFLEFDYIGAPWSDKVKVNPNFILNMAYITVHRHYIFSALISKREYPKVLKRWFVLSKLPFLMHFLWHQHP